MTNSLLLSISDSLQSSRNSSTVPSPHPPESRFIPSKSTLWINALWFTSLTCSLGVCSIAMLIKQWLNAYIFGLSAMHQLRSQTRQRRYDALITWRTGHIINILPLALSLCLMLFFAGLFIMLLSLSKPIALTSIAIISITLIFHLLNLILPAICDCPWKTAISPVMFRLFAPLRVPCQWIILAISRVQFRSIIKNFVKVVKAFVIVCLYMVPATAYLVYGIVWNVPKCLLSCIIPEYVTSTISSMIPERMKSCRPMILSALESTLQAITDALVDFSFLLYSWCRIIFIMATTSWPSESERDHEESMVRKHASALAARAIIWLTQTSTNQRVVDRSVQAIAGLPADADAALVLHQSGVPRLIRARLQSCFRGNELHLPAKAELYARGLLRLHVLVRIRNKGIAMEPRGVDDVFAQALSISPSEDARPAVISCMCAGAMLHEMATALEQHFQGVKPLSSFEAWLLVDTFGQEIAWRKRPAGNHWTNLPLGDWGGLLPRVLPILIHLLDPNILIGQYQRSSTPRHSNCIYHFHVYTRPSNRRCRNIHVGVAP